MLTAPRFGELLPPSEKLHGARLVLDGDGPSPLLMYTVGLPDRPTHPYELATTGLNAELAAGIVRMVVRQLDDDGLQPAEGLELHRVLSGYAVRLHRVQSAEPFRGHAPDTPVWQVLVPDKWGRFPGDPHYTDYPDPHAQPLL